jgi:hypothetical protein
MVKLRLFNGAKTREAWNPDSPKFIDNWKPEERVIKCDSVQLTYGCDLKVYQGDDVQYLELTIDGFVKYRGVFYGDFEVTAMGAN